jgi:acetyltransferase-like isoleucine patch superfamily enzyme
MFSRLVTEIVQSVVKRIKHDPAYRLDPAVGGWALLGIVWRRGWGLVRGAWWSWRLGTCRMPFFVGHRVQILHARQLSLGRGVTLEDDVRIDALSRRGVRFGDNVSVAKFTIIEATGVIGNLGEGFEIGNNSNLGDYNFVGAAGGVRIGQNVLIGQRVSLHSEDHLFERTDLPIKEQGVRRRGIVVEDDCWLGAGVIVLDGVTIGRGSVVAAGSVIARDVAPYSVVAGVPAHLVRRRGGEAHDSSEAGEA